MSEKENKSGNGIDKKNLVLIAVVLLGAVAFFLMPDEDIPENNATGSSSVKMQNQVNGVKSPAGQPPVNVTSNSATNNSGQEQEPLGQKALERPGVNQMIASEGMVKINVGGKLIEVPRDMKIDLEKVVALARPSIAQSNPFMHESMQKALDMAVTRIVNEKIKILEEEQAKKEAEEAGKKGYIVGPNGKIRFEKNKPSIADKELKKLLGLDVDKDKKNNEASVNSITSVPSFIKVKKIVKNGNEIILVDSSGMLISAGGEFYGGKVQRIDNNYIYMYREESAGKGKKAKKEHKKYIVKYALSFE